MRKVTFFLAGILVGLSMVFLVGGVFSTSAQDDQELTSLLPDIEKIYRTCLEEPYRQVEKEIKDPDIASFYHKLMQETGLASR